MVVRVAERIVPHPAAVGGDPVADAQRQDECAHGSGCEHRLGEDLRRRRARRPHELARVLSVHVLVGRDVRRQHDELDLRLGDPARELDPVAEPLLDRVRKRVVVEAQQRQLPEPVRPEGLLRPQRDQERLEIVEAIERRERPRQSARRGAEDPSHAWPERRLAHALEETQLHQHAVHAAAREDDRRVPPQGHLT